MSSTTREAAIKLTLSKGSFKSGMNQLTSHVKRAGRDMGQAIKKPLTDGFKAGKKAAQEMTASAKQGVATIATLGGALSAGAGVKSAMEAEQAYIRLGAQMTQFSGKAVTAAQVQEAVGKAAMGAKAPLDTVRAVMEGISAQTDIGSAADDVERIVMQANRLGVDPEFISRAFTRLKAKTGESSQEIELMIEQFNRMGREMLGVDIDEAIDPNDIAEFTAFAKQAGMSIAQAFAIAQAGGTDAMKDMGQLGEVVEEMGNAFRDSAGLMDLSKAIRIPKGELSSAKSGVENLITILEQGGATGVKEMLKSFGNERTKQALKNILGEALVVDIEGGKKGSAIKADLKLKADALRTAMKATADVEAEKASINKRNADLQNTASASLQDALNKVQLAFESPKMLKAIDSMAQSLPKLADHLADFISYVGENPGKSAAALVLGKVGLAFGGAAIQSAGVAGIKGLFASIGSVQAASAASSVATRGATTLGVGGAAAAGGAAAIATTVVAVLGAAAVGAAIGTLIRKWAKTDDMAEEAAGDRQSAMRDVGQALHIGGRAVQGKGDKAAALAQVQAARKKLADSASVVGEVLSMGQAGRERRFQDAALKKVENQLIQGGAAFGPVVESMDKLQRATEGAANAMTRDTSRGPRNKPASMPGIVVTQM